jgi:hypothetical protein
MAEQATGHPEAEPRWLSALFLVLLYTLSSIVSSHLGTISRIPEMDDSTRNEEVEKGLTQIMLTEPLNPASIEMRLCAGRISLL